MMEEWKEVRGGVGRGEKKENKKEEDEGMVEKGKQKAIVDEEVEKNSFEEQLTPRPQHRQQQQSHSEHQEHSHSKQHYLRQGGPDSDKPEEWYIDQQQPHQVQGQQEQEPQPQPEDERREDILAKTTESDDTCDRLSGMGNEDSTEASPDPRAEHAFSMPTPEPESWYTNQQQQEQREEKQGSCSCCRLGVGSVGSVLGCCPCCCWVPSTPTLELETDSRDQQLEQEQTQEQQFEEELADLQQQEHVSLTPISESEVYYTDQQQQEQKQEQQLEDHPVESSPDQQEPTTPTPIPTESPPDQQIEPFIPTPTQDAHNLHDLEEPPAIPLHRPSYYSRITQDPSHLPPSERRYWLLLSPPQRQHTRALIEAGEETSYQHTWEECNKLVEAQREGKDVDFCY